MKRAFVALAAIPAVIAAALLFFYALFYPVMGLIVHLKGHAPFDKRLLVAMLVCATSGAFLLYSGTRANQSRLAATGCLLIAILLVSCGPYLMYDLAYNPQPPSLRGEEGFGLWFVAVPMSLLGVLGLIGSLPTCVSLYKRRQPPPPFAQTHR